MEYLRHSCPVDVEVNGEKLLRLSAPIPGDNLGSLLGTQPRLNLANWRRGPSRPSFRRCESAAEFREGVGKLSR